jgi:hypothetical protein
MDLDGDVKHKQSKRMEMKGKDIHTIGKEEPLEPWYCERTCRVASSTFYTFIFFFTTARKAS